MIVNPFTSRARLAIDYGRRLSETFGLVGERIPDFDQPERTWAVKGFYLPIPGRSVEGLRAKVEDVKNFICFVNQRDLEVMLGLVSPGDWCKWLEKAYPGPRHRDWIGFVSDPEDLLDDLYDRERELRGHQEERTGHQILPTGLEITRRIHLDHGRDVEELLYLRADMDFETGNYPDVRFSTVYARWIRVERDLVRWKHV